MGSLCKSLLIYMPFFTSITCHLWSFHRQLAWASPGPSWLQPPPARLQSLCDPAEPGQYDIMIVKNVKNFCLFIISAQSPLASTRLTVHAAASGLHKAGYFSFSLSFSLFGSTDGSLSGTQRRHIRCLKRWCIWPHCKEFYKFNTFACWRCRSHGIDEPEQIVSKGILK